MYKILVLVTFVAASLTDGKILAPKLKLNDGREIPALALGTWLGNNTKPSANEVEIAVGWAIDAGYRHIDTAYAYKIEDQVGRGVASKLNEVPRSELFVTTKLWNEHHARDAVIPALQQSLQKLGLNYVDLYLIHWPLGQFANLSYDFTDYLETWRGMMDAKQQGLAKSIGLSNFNEQMIDRIIDNGLEVPAVLQVEMCCHLCILTAPPFKPKFSVTVDVHCCSAAEIDNSDNLRGKKKVLPPVGYQINLNLQQPELLQYCKDKNIVVMGFTPFGSLFYGKAKSDAPPPRVDDPSLVEIAKKYNKTVPQIALRYLIELGVVPIPKSLTKSRIEQNIDVFDFKLMEEERTLLKSFDKGYRTIPQLKWLDHPFYPFKKPLNQKTLLVL